MHHLTLDLSEDTDGLLTIEAMGSTSFEQHAAVLAEAQRLLQWAQRNYAHTQGPVEDGMDWDQRRPGLPRPSFSSSAIRATTPEPRAAIALSAPCWWSPCRQPLPG